MYKKRNNLIYFQIITFFPQWNSMNTVDQATAAKSVAIENWRVIKQSIIFCSKIIIMLRFDFGFIHPFTIICMDVKIIKLTSQELLAGKISYDGFSKKKYQIIAILTIGLCFFYKFSCIALTNLVDENV